MPPSHAGGNIQVPLLIAHRGWPARFPENGLAGLRAAVQAGTRFVEFDVQISRDGVPLAIHDDNLRRTTGVDLSVTETPAAILRSTVEDPDRLPTVAEIAQWLASNPHVTAFVEIKRGSLARFGTARVVAALRPALRPAMAQCIFISFARETVRHARDALGRPVGWVANGWDRRRQRQAEGLSPDFLFIRYDRLPDGPAPTANWLWACYTVDDPMLALDLSRRGVRFVETDDIGKLLAHPVWRQSSRSP